MFTATTTSRESPAPAPCPSAPPHPRARRTAKPDANSGEVEGSIGVRLWRLFSFFTIQSNLIVLAAALVLAWRPSYDSPRWRVLRLDSLLGIGPAGLVFAIVLAPKVHLTGAALAATIGFHYISPWATLAAWLLFGPRLTGTTTFTNWYPYPFLDATEIGLPAALRNASFVLVLGALIALAFKALDHKLPTLKQ